MSSTSPPPLRRNERWGFWADKVIFKGGCKQGVMRSKGFVSSGFCFTRLVREGEWCSDGIMM